MKVRKISFPLEIEGWINRLMGDRDSLKQTDSIVFVTLAESGAIDDVTAAEHLEVFTAWEPNVNYKIGNLRKYEDVLYKCIQAHHSQDDWTPDVSVSLWVKAGDPAEEWPAWSQPIGAQDAYMKGDKVSHNDKHWINDIDSNVWEPGVYGWSETD